MHLKTRNVNTAFIELLRHFKVASNYYPVTWKDGNVVRKPSRNGPVLMIEEPVLVTYTHPRERVLFNQARDCNPFFHLYESLWMLAGRNDVAPLAYYAENMKNYSDDGKTLNGAYGYRWRQYHCDKSGNPESHVIDQLQVLVNHLKADPTSRRAVLQMWNVEDDLLKIGGGGGRIRCTKCYGAGGPVLEEGEPGPAGRCNNCKGTCWIDDPGSRDTCCNLSVMFSLRDQGKHGPIDYVLDMTVTNRSNDMIWGMLGANYVHFTMLQEYMAAHLGVEVGVYNHLTNNLHVYENNWKPEEWLVEYQEKGNQRGHIDYAHCNLYSIPLIKDPAVFDKEVIEFVEQGHCNKEIKVWWNEPFLAQVALPMVGAFQAHKSRNYDQSVKWCKSILADDWRIACTNWIEKRKRQWEARQAHKEQYTQGVDLGDGDDKTVYTEFGGSD